MTKANTEAKHASCTYEVVDTIATDGTVLINVDEELFQPLELEEVGHTE